MSGIFAPDDFRNVGIGEVPVKAADGTFVGSSPTEGTGDMLKSVYDANNSGVVDDAEKLGGELPAHYAADANVAHLAGDEVFTGVKTVPAIQFDTSANEACAKGKVTWDAESGTIKIGMPGGDVCLNVGQEQFIYVKNTSGAIIANGTPVYISGASGANIEVAKALASSQENCRKTIAVATQDIGINAFGYVTTFGFVRDINTNGFTEGGEVYIGVSGGYTQVRPTLPNCIVKIGVCARANANNGIVHVNITPISRTEVLADTGDLTIRTEANKTVVLEQPVYDDFLPSIMTPAVGVAAPDIINLTIQGVTFSGYGFDGVNTEERLAIKTEMYHSYKEGTTICAHIHFMPTTNDAGTVIWYFDYFYSPANATPVAGGTISATINIPANSLGKHFLVDIGDITIAELGIGDFIIGNLRRTPANDTYPADAMLMQFANHVQIDTIGSRQEYIK